MIRFSRAVGAAALALSLCLALTDLPVRAQSGDALPDWLTAEERQRIEKERDEKNRAETLLKVSSARLLNARNNVNAQEFAQAREEIKHFGSLINYTAAYIQTSPKKENDKKKIYKMIELHLRQALSSLETLRFELPADYADEATKVYEDVRKVREQALGAVFGNDFFPPVTPGQDLKSPENISNEKK